MNSNLIAAFLLAVLCYVSLRGPRSESDMELASELLGSNDVERLELPDAADMPAFRAGSRTALFFERQGMQGLIRGVLVVDDDRVVDLQILQSHEGLGADPLESPDFLALFRDKPAKPPLAVDAVSGATISSQAVKDAVNARLKAWFEFTEGERGAGSQQ